MLQVTRSASRLTRHGDWDLLRQRTLGGCAARMRDGNGGIKWRTAARLQAANIECPRRPRAAPATRRSKDSPLPSTRYAVDPGASLSSLLRRRRGKNIQPCLVPVDWDGSAKMEWVPEILQFPIIVECGRALSVEPQVLQELDFLLRSVTAQGRVAKEFLEPRLVL